VNSPDLDAMAEESPGARADLQVYDHVDGALGEDLERLRERSVAALPHCLVAKARGGDGVAVLGELEVIEVSVVSDEAIAGVHGDFMDDPTPTDVITFHHGEILVSRDTALRRAGEFGHPVLRELLLYVIHGLLHLNGHDDHEEGARAEMHRLQEAILASVWPLPDSSKQ
jgi:probable rRNA maturation factor